MTERMSLFTALQQEQLKTRNFLEQEQGDIQMPVDQNLKNEIETNKEILSLLQNDEYQIMIPVLGKKGAGKKTFFNALIGQAIYSTDTNVVPNFIVYHYYNPNSGRYYLYQAGYSSSVNYEFPVKDHVVAEGVEQIHNYLKDFSIYKNNYNKEVYSFIYEGPMNLLDKYSIFAECNICFVYTPSLENITGQSEKNCLKKIFQQKPENFVYAPLFLSAPETLTSKSLNTILRDVKIRMNKNDLNCKREGIIKLTTGQYPRYQSKQELDYFTFIISKGEGEIDFEGLKSHHSLNSDKDLNEIIARTEFGISAQEIFRKNVLLRQVSNFQLFQKDYEFTYRQLFVRNNDFFRKIFDTLDIPNREEQMQKGDLKYLTQESFSLIYSKQGQQNLKQYYFNDDEYYSLDFLDQVIEDCQNLYINSLRKQRKLCRILINSQEKGDILLELSSKDRLTVQNIGDDMEFRLIKVFEGINSQKYSREEQLIKQQQSISDYIDKSQYSLYRLKKRNKTLNFEDEACQFEIQKVRENLDREIKSFQINIIDQNIKSAYKRVFRVLNDYKDGFSEKGLNLLKDRFLLYQESEYQDRSMQAQALNYLPILLIVLLLALIIVGVVLYQIFGDEEEMWFEGLGEDVQWVYVILGIVFLAIVILCSFYLYTLLSTQTKLGFEPTVKINFAKLKKKYYKKLEKHDQKCESILENYQKNILTFFKKIKEDYPQQPNENSQLLKKQNTGERSKSNKQIK